MFTGLVEATAQIQSITDLGDQKRLELSLPFANEITLGESIAVNGCCLTVSEFDTSSAKFDILTQTLNITSLGDLTEGSLVNVERALKASDRLGGHFVQGHIDATGVIADLSPAGQDHRLEVKLNPEQHSLCIDKGSISIDGISLTIAELTEDSCIFWITPHTFAHTNLQNLTQGRKVNIEVDVLAKYIAKLARK